VTVPMPQSTRELAGSFVVQVMVMLVLVTAIVGPLVITGRGRIDCPSRAGATASAVPH